MSNKFNPIEFTALRCTMQRGMLCIQPTINAENATALQLRERHLARGEELTLICCHRTDSTAHTSPPTSLKCACRLGNESLIYYYCGKWF